MKTELKAKFLQHLIDKKKGEEGFTLIELLVVIIIIGILSAIALPSFLNQANKARQSEAQTYVGAINRGQQAYYLEKNTFGSLSNLELGISNTKNYTYGSSAAGSGAAAVANTTATPTATLRGYVGKVWVANANDGSSTTLALLCEGPIGSTPPLIQGTVCS